MRILFITAAASEANFDNVVSYTSDTVPRLAELSWIVTDENLKVIEIERKHYIIPDEDFKRVSPKARAINGLSVDFLRKKGEPLKIVLAKILKQVTLANVVVSADLWFIKKLLMSEFDKNLPGTNFNTLFTSTKGIDILDVSRKLVNAKYPNMKSGVRRPTLKETVKKLTDTDIPADTYNEKTITHIMKCFAVLKKLSLVEL